MKALVRVVAADANHVWVELAKSASECGGCAGLCSMLLARGRGSVRLDAGALEPPVAEQELLVVSVGAGPLLRATALACGLPVIGLVLAATLADLATSAAWLPPALGLAGLALGTALAGFGIARNGALRLHARRARLAGA